ncbi:hypothetical protein GF323_03295 [Candidatus Woesearchaeota archaeon]|nr:hypothetical protein [Candidatus Woesearchaeota archaeon]
MAKKDKKTEKKVILERVYNVPLRKEFLKASKRKRSKKAVTALREFLVRHMKSGKVRIGKYANLKIWENGIKNPPHHIKIVAKKDEEGNVFAELEGAPVETPIEAKKPPKKAVDAKETKKKGKESIEEEFKKLEEKTEKAKEEKAEKAKETQKEEIKELQKEHPKQHAPKEAAKEKKVEARPNAPKGKSGMSRP